MLVLNFNSHDMREGKEESEIKRQYSFCLHKNQNRSEWDSSGVNKVEHGTHTANNIKTKHTKHCKNIQTVSMQINKKD